MRYGMFDILKERRVNLGAETFHIITQYRLVKLLKQVPFLLIYTHPHELHRERLVLFFRKLLYASWIAHRNVPKYPFIYIIFRMRFRFCQRLNKVVKRVVILKMRSMMASGVNLELFPGKRTAMAAL